jgi:hypothetical protein
MTGSGTAAVYTQYQNTGGNFYVGRDNSAGNLFGSSYASFLYATGAYPMIFLTNDAERMRISAAGNVAIGTTSPVGALTVQRASAESNIALCHTASGDRYGYIFSTTGTTTNDLTISSEINGTNTERLRISSAGNLSIGIGASGSSAISKLDIAVKNVSTLGAPASSGLSIDSNDNNIVVGNISQISFGLRNAFQPSYIAHVVTSASAYSNGALVFGTRSATTDTAPSERLRITSAGNVGIGTSSPSGKLHVIGSGTQIITEPSLGSGNTELMIGRGYSLSGTAATVGTKSSVNCAFEGSDDNAYSAFGYVTTAVGTRSQIATAFYIETKSAGSSTPAERARIDSSGNLLVGTTTNAINDSNSIVIVSNNGSVVGQVICNHGTGTGSGERFANFGLAGTSIGSITQNGTTAVAYNTSSDYRLKNTIAPMTGALAKVALLKPVTYKWNADGSDGEGFIAHELAEVCPSAVTGAKDAVDADGKPIHQGIDVSFLVATLTAAIQELKADFDAYKASHP